MRGGDSNVFDDRVRGRIDDDRFVRAARRHDDASPVGRDREPRGLRADVNRGCDGVVSGRDYFDRSAIHTGYVDLLAVRSDDQAIRRGDRDFGQNLSRYRIEYGNRLITE